MEDTNRPPMIMEMASNRFAITEMDLLTALGVSTIRSPAADGRLGAGDLLALSYIRGHLACGRIPPVGWLVDTANSTRFRYKVAGADALGLVRFALDYAATRFRPVDRTPDKLGAHFDWYLAVKEISALEHRGEDAPGVILDENLRARLATDTMRHRELPKTTLDAWRAEWEQAVRSLDQWRTYRVA